jgi:hypothetical protein
MGMGSNFHAVEIPRDRYQGIGGSGKHNGEAKGAFGGRSKKQKKAEFLDRSQADAREIATRKSWTRTYRDWFNALTAAEQEFARAKGIDRPLTDRSRPAGAAEPDLDFREDHAVPHGAECGRHNGRPILRREEGLSADFADERRFTDGKGIGDDASEPLRKSAQSADNLCLGSEEIRDAHEAFARALVWAFKAGHLVKKGQRMAALIGYCRPDLAAGPIPAGLLGELQFLLIENAAQLGIIYGRVFDWCRQASTFSALGVRLNVIGYVLRPDLLDAATNTVLGEPTNATRQAINKLVGEFRDTFSGLQAPAMRGENTRLKCRQAQTTAAA